MLTSEYTTPLKGVPYFRSVGVIKAFDQSANQYNIGEVAYERYDDQNFQYIFSPYWKLIEYLPKAVFDGIPGIDMSVKKQHYYRVNMTPSFITKRTPSESREDLWELLEEVGLDYYDRFEWLLRTDKYCGDDNLVVERRRSEPMTFVGADAETINRLQPGDEVKLNKVSDISSNRSQLSGTLFRLLQSGAIIHIKEDNMMFSIENCNPLYILERMTAYDKSYHSMRQQAGVERAKAEGKYKGRKRIAVDMLLFADIVEKFENGLLTEQQALDSVDMSRSTFYRRMREWKYKKI